MDINQTIESIIALHDSGGNPSQMMQMMINRNPNISQMGNQYQTAIKGKNTTDVLLQLAKQGGVSEQNLQGLARILGAKK